MSREPRAGAEHMHRLVREGGILAGGATAILLQLAHPSVGRGVAEHSDFAARPMDRLYGTLSYIYCMVYGTDEEIRRVSESVGRAHSAVHGPGYDANDPEQQLWVAATLYHTASRVYGEFFGPLEERTAERIYQEYAFLGTALRVAPSSWPSDRAEFQTYWDDMVRTIEVTPAARRVAAELMSARHAPIWVRAAMPLNRLLTSAWLPEPIRVGYGMPWTSRMRRRYELLMRAGSAVYPRLPVAVRRIPVTMSLYRTRRSLQRGRSPIDVK